MPQQPPISLQEARALTLAHIRALPAQVVDLADAVDRVAFEELPARVDSPSVDASLKDGYAVDSRSVTTASPERPIRLALAGEAAAGSVPGVAVTAHTTVRVLTGAAVPSGADAVVSEEYTSRQGRDILFFHFAEPGRNVMPKGSDVAAGDPVVRKGQVLTPGRLGLLAAAGHCRIGVAPSLRVGILATGDEVTGPGMPLGRGKLYASNMVTLSAWCRRFGMETVSAIAPDESGALVQALRSLESRCDAVITSGGAWTGDRDLVAGVLRGMGWRQVFHRVRMGPGKAVGFGLLAEKPVFILPGGPPSNVIGFLQIALPGLMQQSGRGQDALPVMRVRAGQDLAGRNMDWTHFVFGRLESQVPLPLFFPLGRGSRLLALAEATALAAVPEGCSRIEAGTEITVQLLTESRTCLAAEE